MVALLDHLGIQRAKAIGLRPGAWTLLHVATAQPERLMVLVSATYFPQPLRDAAARFARAAFSLPAAERDARARHVHGDEQVARCMT